MKKAPKSAELIRLTQFLVLRIDRYLHQLLTKKSLLKDAVVTPEQVMPSPGGFEEQAWSPSQRLSFDDVSRLSWQQFEALCAELLLRGHQSDNCWLTHSGGDYGADVVLTKCQNAMLVQCKHTEGRTYDGYQAVTEVHSAKIKYEDELGKQVHSLVFVTNAVRLGARTRKAAKQYSVSVFDGKELSVLLGKDFVTYEDVVGRLEKERLGA